MIILQKSGWCRVFIYYFENCESIGESILKGLPSWKYISKVLLSKGCGLISELSF